MSLVNLSHVCSHLQNASLARLGLTSIPYTRLHLSLALLLQKQGFLSQVKLAGPSPPASCFPPGLRDNHRVTSHPPSDRRHLTPERALQRMVENGVDEQELRQEGFDEEAIEFAAKKRQKTVAQLERDGWDRVVVDFLLRHRGKEVSRLEDEGLDATAIAILESHSKLLDACETELKFWRTDQPVTNDQLRSALLREGFSLDTLQHFAGPSRFISPRELLLDGLPIEAMGLEIPNQPFQPPPPPSAADPFDLETEGVVTQANRASRRLWLGLKYWDGLPVLSKARMLSKPTKRIWLGERDLQKLVTGREAGEIRPLTKVGELMAVNTTRGVMEVRECVERKIGGMMLCRVW